MAWGSRIIYFFIGEMCFGTPGIDYRIECWSNEFCSIYYSGLSCSGKDHFFNINFTLSEGISHMVAYGDSIECRSSFFLSKFIVDHMPLHLSSRMVELGVNDNDLGVIISRLE